MVCNIDFHNHSHHISCAGLLRQLLVATDPYAELQLQRNLVTQHKSASAITAQEEDLIKDVPDKESLLESWW